MPACCQFAVQSWKARNPSWKIIIVSDHNFQQYVAWDDLPKTFWSLQVQHRSDFIRMAVLKRYGGLYLDTSYFLFKGIDNVWDEAVSNNHFYITAPINLASSNNNSDDIPFFNNGFLMAPKPNNPLISTLQKRAIEYFECPCKTLAEMKEHSAFRRVNHHFNDPICGKFPGLIPYWSMLWLLLDNIYYDPTMADYVKTHVHVLPALKWSESSVMLEVPYSQDLNRKVYDLLNPWSIVKKMSKMLSWILRDSPEEAQSFVDAVVAMKLSTSFMLPVDVAATSNGNTLSRILHLALDADRKTAQASLDGVRLVQLAADDGETGNKKSN